MDKNCPFCRELSGLGVKHDVRYDVLIRNGKTTLLKGLSLSVIPNLGALNSSHLLIVPHRHVLSLATLSQTERDELTTIKSIIRSANQDHEETTEFWEHGTGEVVNLSGSCISHAHLHAITNAEPLKSLLVSCHQFVSIESGDFYGNRLLIERGYGMFEDSTGALLINALTELPPQFFRRCYSSLIQSNPTWDWRQRYDYEIIELMLKRFSGLQQTFERRRLM